MPNCVKFQSSWLTSARVSPAVAAPFGTTKNQKQHAASQEGRREGRDGHLPRRPPARLGRPRLHGRLAIDQAPGFIDVNTGKEMEGELDKAELKRQALKGEIKPCGMEHIYYMFPRDKKK